MAQFNTENPAANDDPRFDPESDAENALAHGEEPDVQKEADDDVQDVLRRQIEEAVQHYQENLEPDQVEATNYYYGRPFGDEEEGRSQVVSTDVRDATQAQLPSLMRIFFGPERVVEFRPRGPEDVGLAEQQTDMVDFVAKEDNPGFLILHAAFKDALVRRLGVFKWWWDEFSRVKEQTLVVNHGQLVQIQQDPRVEDYEIVSRDVLFPLIGTAECKVRYRDSDGRARFVAVPPDEFVYTPNARDLESAPLVAHVREVALDELVGMGLDEDLVRSKVGKRKPSSSESLEFARHFHAGDAAPGDDTTADASQQKVPFAEAYALIDVDGDGIAERRKFLCVGDDYEIANGDGAGEIVDEVPFSVLTPDPEPHTLVGLSNYDYLRDVQRVKSHVLRRTLDSLSLAVENQTVVVEGQVNMQDVVNPEVSNVIRVRRDANMDIRELTHTFVGMHTLPMLAYYDEIKENRTGISKAAAGLDADSLQSSTKAAVAATLTGAQQHIEMIARVFAETGVKRLYKGLLRLLVENQAQARMVRLRGKYVEMDPRSWDADMDVQVNIALGFGGNEEKLAALVQIATAQDALSAQGSPLVTNVEKRRTLDRFVQLVGYRDSSEFFRPWGPEEEAAMQQQMAAQPPQPDPAMMLMEVEKAKAQMDAIIQQQKMELARWEARMEDDRERDRMAREMALREHEIELKHAADIEDSKLKAKVQRDRAEMDRDVKREAAMNQPTEKAA